MSNNKTNLLKSLLSEAEALSYNDNNLDKVIKRADMLVKKIFGNDSDYIGKLKKIRFSPSMMWSGMSDSVYYSSFNSGKLELINLTNVMLEDLSLTEFIEVPTASNSENSILSENVL